MEKTNRMVNVGKNEKKMPSVVIKKKIKFLFSNTYHIAL